MERRPRTPWEAPLRAPAADRGFFFKGRASVDPIPVNSTRGSGAVFDELLRAPIRLGGDERESFAQVVAVPTPRTGGPRSMQDMHVLHILSRVTLLDAIALPVRAFDCTHSFLRLSSFSSVAASVYAGAANFLRRPV